MALTQAQIDTGYSILGIPNSDSVFHISALFTFAGAMAEFFDISRIKVELDSRFSGLSATQEADAIILINRYIALATKRTVVTKSGNNDGVLADFDRERSQIRRQFQTLIGVTMRLPNGPQVTR